MKTCFISFLVLLMLAAAGMGGAYWYAHQYYKQPGPLAHSETIIIERGSGFKQIASLLEQQGVIKKPELFMAMVYLGGQQEQFKAGEYLFPAKISPEKVAGLLIEGKTVTHRVTIPEGLMSEDILAILKVEPLLVGDVPERIEEGSVLPETYHYLRGEKRLDVLARMQASMQKTIAELWEQRQSRLPIASPKEAVVLASIVEKETGVGAERAKVAGVFINRLRKGMKLQSDPTTIYGMYHTTGKRHKTIYRSHLQAENAYNTYVIDGLPPTPIAHPGRAALEAVMQPMETEALYFVANGTGGHAFSKTLAEHNRNVAAYRAWLRTQQ